MRSVLFYVARYLRQITWRKAADLECCNIDIVALGPTIHIGVISLITKGVNFAVLICS